MYLADGGMQGEPTEERAAEQPGGAEVVADAREVREGVGVSGSRTHGNVGVYPALSTANPVRGAGALAIPVREYPQPQ